MDRLWLCVALAALFCAVSSSQEGISGAEEELRVRPGDNVTLYCDCGWASGGSVLEWYRNCSHDNQPTLVMSVFKDKRYDNILTPFPGFKLVQNQSRDTFDLLIENVTESDLGLYYCGIEETTELGFVYRPENVVTKLLLEPAPYEQVCPDSKCDQCRILLLTLCPGCALLSSLLSSALVYHFFNKKTASKELQGNPQTDSRGRWSRVQGEGDVCYTADFSTCTYLLSPQN